MIAWSKITGNGNILVYIYGHSNQIGSNEIHFSKPQNLKYQIQNLKVRSSRVQRHFKSKPYLLSVAKQEMIIPLSIKKDVLIQY